MPTLILGPVTLDDIGRPPRLPFNRSETQHTYTPAAHNLPGVWSDYGLRGYFTHTFQSQQNTGHITLAQVRQLEALERAGQPFTLRTDHFAGENEVETYTARFDPEVKPQYSPVAMRLGVWMHVYQIPLFIFTQPPTP